MTKEQEKSTIAALVEERRGYEVRAVGAEEAGDDEALAAAKDRVAQVDAELKKLGAAATKASTRSEKRPGGRGSSKR